MLGVDREECGFRATAASARRIAPAMTIDSLFASARSLPDRNAASDGRSPLAPAMPLTTMIRVDLLDHVDRRLRPP